MSVRKYSMCVCSVLWTVQRKISCHLCSSHSKAALCFLTSLIRLPVVSTMPAQWTQQVSHVCSTTSGKSKQYHFLINWADLWYNKHQSHFQQVTYAHSFTTILTGTLSKLTKLIIFSFLIKISIQNIGETDYYYKKYPLQQKISFPELCLSQKEQWIVSFSRIYTTLFIYKFDTWRHDIHMKTSQNLFKK